MLRDKIAYWERLIDGIQVPGAQVLIQRPDEPAGCEPPGRISGPGYRASGEASIFVSIQTRIDLCTITIFKN
jgi:hypothetical protein